MDMERFKQELAKASGPHGEKAWKLVEDWYTRDGRARRLSLHDLHSLSKAIADALKDASPSLPKDNGEGGWTVQYDYLRHIAETMNQEFRTGMEEIEAVLLAHAQLQLGSVVFSEEDRYVYDDAKPAAPEPKEES